MLVTKSWSRKKSTYPWKLSNKLKNDEEKRRKCKYESTSWAENKKGKKTKKNQGNWWKIKVFIVDSDNDKKK